ncbi:MAG: ATP-binding cassette domain-containing protein [Ectothiorhodospiraceae bacterium]|nr:ATP-binding cassette domain-containing protein [Ectothiorhodospiraceae bacterium]
MLAIEGLDVHIGAIRILESVDLDLPAGVLGGLIGRNGAGKTTLMRSVMGAIRATGGRIRYQNHDLLGLRAHERAALGIGYMPEDRKLVPELTTEENMLLPAWATRMRSIEERLPLVYEFMPELREMRTRRANQLSGGQQKMVALGRALMCGTQLLLLDEPFEGLAPALARRLAQVIADLKREKVSILLADSNQQHAADLLDRVYPIERGRISDD